MNIEAHTLKLLKPSIFDYKDMNLFIKDQIDYLKKMDRSYSVLTMSKKLRRISPALISLIIKGKRKITLDRTDELAKLLQLSIIEKNYLKDCITPLSSSDAGSSPLSLIDKKKSSRVQSVSLHLLNDWLNVYVKDSFQIPTVQKNPELIYSQLAHIATRKRIQRSFAFLIREGYLRRTLDNQVVVETDLALTESPIPNIKIRQFHKAALEIAKQSLETVEMNKRLSNSLVLPLNEEKVEELKELIHHFAHQLKEFASDLQPDDTYQLHQININLTPTGRKP